ncbi:Adenine deaminase [Thalassocella blandensis]|nr:Adenine deaminase [Thalassocella blandensis]
MSLSQDLTSEAIDKEKFANWLAKIPKAELHLHIDGSLQAERLLELAQKNKVELPYSNLKEIEDAYNFVDLQSFLDLYYLGASVLRDEEDFYWLMMDYLTKCRDQHIVHSEIMVEPQTYFPQGVEFRTMMNGFKRAIHEANETWGQSVLLILSFLRHLPEEDAIATLEKADEFRDDFCAIGLASAEKGNPPNKFQRLYQMAKERGYEAIAHAGEEGPADYIWQSLQQLHVSRVDHGVRCVDDEGLVNFLIENKIPLTVCPLSNIRLCVYDQMQQHPILQLLDRGVRITVNSDDPTYFGGFLNENYFALLHELNMSKEQAITLAENGFKASFLSNERKESFIHQLHAYC